MLTLRAENCIAIEWWHEECWKFENVGKIHVSTCPIFAGPVTNIFVFLVDLSDLCVMCGSADLYDNWVGQM